MKKLVSLVSALVIVAAATTFPTSTAHMSEPLLDTELLYGGATRGYLNGDLVFVQHGGEIPWSTLSSITLSELEGHHLGHLSSIFSNTEVAWNIWGITNDYMTSGDDLTTSIRRYSADISDAAIGYGDARFTSGGTDSDGDGVADEICVSPPSPYVANVYNPYGLSLVLEGMRTGYIAFDSASNVFSTIYGPVDVCIPSAHIEAVIDDVVEAICAVWTIDPELAGATCSYMEINYGTGATCGIPNGWPIHDMGDYLSLLDYLAWQIGSSTTSKYFTYENWAPKTLTIYDNTQQLGTLLVDSL